MKLQLFIHVSTYLKSLVKHLVALSTPLSLERDHCISNLLHFGYVTLDMLLTLPKTPFPFSLFFLRKKTFFLKERM